MKKYLLVSLLVTTAAFAQNDAVRNVSGTTPAAGPSPFVQTQIGNWTFFHGFDAHVTYVSQTGPEEQENEVFSTNWFAAGAQLPLGDRAFLLARGRVSLEPYTTEDGYPQIFQYVREENGGPLIDRMRPQDLFGEAGVEVGYRPTDNTVVSVYGALVGQPALGPAPWQLRASGIDFAEAPFAYDIQESYQTATSVVTATAGTSWIKLEGSMFHAATPEGDFTELDTGGMDSNSLRVTLTPSRNWAMQVSRGELGEEELQREITSASISYAGSMVAVTALWTGRSLERSFAGAPREDEMAYGLEVALRGGRNTFMARAEHVDRPENFPLLPFGTGTREATHYTAGYIFDLISNRYRAGLGVNIDYRTQTHDLEDIYGHKPQGIYAFVRLRTGA